MADVATADMSTSIDPVPSKRNRSRKALKPKNPSSNQANILISQPSPTLIPPPENYPAGKENHESLSQPRSVKKSRGAAKAKQSASSFEKELQEMQVKLEQLKLEKEKTEELLKTRDEMLKAKEEELENRGKEQERLQMEVKKLQKIKEFKPTMAIPIVQSLRDKEQENKEKKKTKKGAHQVKRPSPAYTLWCKDQWAEIKKENPGAEFKEISNILGAKWKTVSAEEKKPYEEKYQAEKEAYLKVIGHEKRENEAMKLLEDEQKQKTAMELLEQYIQFKHEAEVEDKKKKTKKQRDPMKPKHPISAYFLFANERRAALVAETKNFLEIAKITGQEWRNMTEAEKSPYEEMAKVNKEKYAEEMKAYTQQKEEEADILRKEEEEVMKIHKQEALQLLKKKEKTDNIIKKTKEKKKSKKEEKNADPNKPKRPASSFLMFSKEERKNLQQERPGITNSTLNALISVKWKELGEQEKQMWNEKASEAMEAYKKEVEEYNKTAVVDA